MLITELRSGEFYATHQNLDPYGASVLDALEGVNAEGFSSGTELRRSLEGLSFGIDEETDRRLEAELLRATHSAMDVGGLVQAQFLLKAAGHPIERSEIERNIEGLRARAGEFDSLEETLVARRLLALDWDKLLSALEE